ncbi:MAG: hypothetical protein U0903_06565 [Planctomycetales bacterium]
MAAESGRDRDQKSWLDEEGHVREQFADGGLERLRWNISGPMTRGRGRTSMAEASSRIIWTKPYEWFGDGGLGLHRRWR